MRLCIFGTSENLYFHHDARFEMMEQCWKTVKEERPTFTEMKIKLKAARLALRKRQRLNSVANDKQDEDNYINDDMGPDNNEQ